MYSKQSRKICLSGNKAIGRNQHSHFVKGQALIPVNPHDPFGPELSSDDRTVVQRAVAELRNR